MIKGNEEKGRGGSDLKLPQVIESRSAAETEDFVRGLASAVTPGAHVCSPTYTIVNEYRGGGRVLCHLDLYRIEGEDDLYSVGFYDYEGVMMAAEWCEKALFALPDKYLRITIEKTGDESRRITAEAVDSASQG